MFSTIYKPENDTYIERGFCTSSIPQGIFEGLKVKDERPKELANFAEGIETSAAWLPGVADTYKVSSSFKDYILVPTTLMLADYPNTNGCSFPLEVLASFSPEIGQFVYESWRRMPLFVEHANEDLEQARGIIFDTSLHKKMSHGTEVFALDALLGFDRGKDSVLASKVLHDPNSTFSMGALCKTFLCSITGKNLKEMGGASQYVNLNQPASVYMKPLADGRLPYRVAQGVKGFETSFVSVPAFFTATRQRAWG